ncbi:hypothetical protein IQ247_20295 [Plectonema cf. radiosum LEGE 06105]|uniref:Uncharacterized protein n=1 Tax=Plectonema cf. radiosum LEGE 06105 TaxID=945769 RepID=A0A8J7K1S0_9CYAN|nr:hypothetical protein [Plectonema radiosum]MBE9214981.1 hypothetical protein [Plectonema cf. radiosum LEGE 06105]
MQQVKNYRKLAFTAILSSGLTVTILGLVTPRVFAQQTTTSSLTVQSTGTISGTLVLPFFNPNYNKVLTRIDTDENGAYYRNIGTKQNPELVQVYKSEYVKVNVRDDGSMNYHVNFKGIPVASFDAIIKSPVLSDGEMTTFRYDGRPDMEGTVIKGVVQDEFGVKRAFYTGILTDPNTGTQYQGTFELTGQGPRYSDRNGGDSPNVFDYKSDQPGLPRSEPYKIKDDSPLVKLYINVPEGTTILNSSTGSTTSTSTGGTSTSTGNETSTSTGGGTSTSTGGTNSTPPTTFTPPSLPITSTSPGGTNSTPPITSTSTGGTSTSTGGTNSTPPITSTSTGGTNSTPPTTFTPPSLPITSTSPGGTSTSTGNTNSTPPTTFTPPSLPITSTSPGGGTSTSTGGTNSTPPTTFTPPSLPITSTSSDGETSTTSIFSTPSISSTPSTDVSNIEFSSGNSFVANSVLEKSSNIGNKSDENISQSKQRGPRSRIMIR